MMIPKRSQLALLIVGGLLGSSSWAQPSVAASGSVMSEPQVVEQQIRNALSAGEVALDRRSLVQWVLLRNPEVLLTREQRRVAEQQIRMDRGAFTPEFFSVLSSDGNQVPNHPEAAIPETVDRNRRFTVGVRSLVLTGAEISVEYETRYQFQNVPSATTGLDGIDDVTGRLGFKVRQPLLRGAGAAQIKGRIEQSERQLEISRQEILQQTLSKSFDALSLYWRLYRAEQIRDLNEASLDYSRRTFDNLQHLVNAGRLPQTALAEVRSTILLREAEAFVAQQAFDQVETALKNLLNLSASAYGHLGFRTLGTPDATVWQRPQHFNSYLEQVLQTWPNHEIALARLAIEQQQVDMARDEMRPRLDLVASYHHNSRNFDKSYRGAWRDVSSSRYDGWSAGIEFSMPLGGHSSARARYDMAQIRLDQSRMQAESVRVDLANQLWLRLEQVEQTFEELQRHRQNIEVLRELLLVEQARFESGVSRYSDLIDREDRLNSATVRMVDAEIRYEMAKASLQLSDGSLLAHMGVSVDVDL